jgi:hypothetical protein
MDKQLLKQINDLQKERQELLVLIDTLQTNLRAVSSHLSDSDRETVQKVPSYKWCLNWRSDN